MASQAPSLGRGVCPEKQLLADAYVEATRDVMKLQEQEIAAVAQSGKELDRFDLALQRARGERDRAKSLYTLHVCAHGC